MTAQIHEKLKYQGQSLNLASEPLSSYFKQAGISPPRGSCTALWRGYVGTWEIVDKRLYLIGMESPFGLTTTMSELFPGYSDRVFAHWYTGKLLVHAGDCVEYHHGGFGGIYEKNFEFLVECGCILGEEPKITGVKSNKNYNPMAYTVIGGVN